MQKFSSFGRKKKQTKIRHRMVMLEGLHMMETRGKSLFTSQLAHQAGAELRFLLPLDGMLVHCKDTPSIMIAGTHLYTWVKRDNME